MESFDFEKLNKEKNVQNIGTLRLLRNPHSPNYGYESDVGECFSMWKNDNNYYKI